MIKAEHLTKKYRKKLAVDDVSFVIEAGKVTGFLGPNGAGKSTTMRLMLGLDRGQGQTTYDGKSLQAYSNPSHVVGILLEAKAFHPTRSARSHLSILATQGGISASRVDEVLETVGLSDVAKNKPGKFSLGMSQRLGIAAAILGKPKYLLLDEPANGLDPEGIKWLRDFLKDYAAQGNAVFVSSHLLSEMSMMAENIVVIGKGKMIAHTSIKDLLAGNGHAGVFVRADGNQKLEHALQKANITYKQQDGGFQLAGTTTDIVGRIAFDAGVAVLELAAHGATLEEAFLELTANAQEYHAVTGAQNTKGPNS